MRTGLCVALAVVLALVALARGGQEERFEFTQVHMGVAARVVLYATDEGEAAEAARAAFARIAEIDSIASDYRVESELTRLNARAGEGPVAVSAELLEMLGIAVRVSEATGGAYDPTIGPYVQRWREARRTRVLSGGGEFAPVGVGLLKVDASSGTVELMRRGMRLDLGGLAKGYAAREAVSALRALGHGRCLVDVGGDLVAGDPPPGREGWRVTVDAGVGEAGTIVLANAAASTSGDREQFVEIEGVRYSHVIDPRTGLGSTIRAEACVIARDGAVSDALATAMCVVGADGAEAVLERFDGASAVVVEARGEHAKRFVSEDFPTIDRGMFDPGNVPPKGFEAMFNGRDLSGWQGLIELPARLQMDAEERARTQAAADERMRAHWRAEDGVLVFDGQGESLQSARDYEDFELYVDWMIEEGGDSGIYLRGTPQVQIWDNEIGSGGLYNNERNPSRPIVVADSPVGKWNRFHIIMRDDRVTVHLNGRLVTDEVVLENYWDRTRPVFGRGPIELQAHGSPLKFRNIFVRELRETERTERDQRMAWWREARFGMFIHWGLYAIPAGVWEGERVGGVGEWIMHSARIPVDEYERLAPLFNPVKFDADEWARIAAEAGMKYVVITSKHHDGFCLFDSAHTTWDVMDATPFGRDIMKELSEACARRGLRMCWYHSIMDWHHPDYLPRREWDARPDAGADFDRYVQYLRGQVTELLTKYGPIGVMWFDGEWEETWTESHGKALYELCRSLQPEVIVNNRVGKGRSGMAGLTREGDFAGDFGTPEQEVPAMGLPGVDWESCMTMNDTWGYKEHDKNWKSGKELIRTLIDIASKGGNFLLNVGPTAEGEIPAASVDRLGQIGAWIDVNGESIYGTSASPFARLTWGRCTSRPGRLYLHVFEWPESGRLIVPGLLNEIAGATLLETGDSLTVEMDAAGVAIRVPAEAVDEIATVIALDIVGEPAVVEMPIVPGVDGVLTLRASDATVEGTTARYEGGADHQNIGYWTDAADTVRWDARAPAGRYRVEITYACDPATPGATYRVRIGDQTVEGHVEPTGSWTTWRTAALGEVELTGGPVTCIVEPLSKPGFAVMNLRAVRLSPVRPQR